MGGRRRPVGRSVSQIPVRRAFVLSSKYSTESDPLAVEIRARSRAGRSASPSSARTWTCRIRYVRSMRRLWVVVRIASSAVLLILSAWALELSIAHSRYDSQDNRAPAARIAGAAAALLAALAALASARRSSRGVAFTFLALFLYLVWLMIHLGSGRL